MEAIISPGKIHGKSMGDHCSALDLDPSAVQEALGRLAGHWLMSWLSCMDPKEDEDYRVNQKMGMYAS